jgi:membrane-associated phospholipid phosphatase
MGEVAPRHRHDGRPAGWWPAGAAVLGLALLLAPVEGQAQDATTPDLEYRAAVDVPLTLAGIAGALAPRYLSDEESSWVCRWCDRDEQGEDTLNAVDAWARRDWRWSDRSKAHSWSNTTLALSFVAPATLFTVNRGGLSDDLLIVLEASAVNLALTQATKHLFRRARPWAHYGDPPPDQYLGSRDSALSFVSGHTSLAFAMAVSTGSLASLGNDDGKEWVWATGLSFAAATGYLRIAADKHYVTDVLAGAALGTTVGWVIPRLFDRRESSATEPVVLRPTPPVPAFSVPLGAGSHHSGVRLGGGLHHGGPFLSATWTFR